MWAGCSNVGTWQKRRDLTRFLLPVNFSVQAKTLEYTKIKQHISSLWEQSWNSSGLINGHVAFRHNFAEEDENPYSCMSWNNISFSRNSLLQKHSYGLTMIIDNRDCAVNSSKYPLTLREEQRPCLVKSVNLLIDFNGALDRSGLHKGGSVPPSKSRTKESSYICGSCSTSILSGTDRINVSKVNMF